MSEPEADLISGISGKSIRVYMNISSYFFAQK